MNPLRRALMLGALASPWQPARGETFVPRRELVFPRDHGVHPDARIEWWYVTGWLEQASSNPLGFQLTFFRSRTDLAADLPGRFAPRQLLFAHAALSDVAQRRLRHAQRMVRWSGDERQRDAYAASRDTDVAIGDWRIARSGAAEGGEYHLQMADRGSGIALDLRLRATQPLLLQGERGLSRKGPLAQQASYYLSLPQLAVQGRVSRDGREQTVQGRAWLDHEWSDELLAADALGWDWIGINLHDGSALCAFQLRRRDGTALWAGGSWRAAGAPARPFGADELRFLPGQIWVSPATGARYPVRWQVDTPLGRYAVQALFDAQELDTRASTGNVYWEGLCELLDARGRPLGRGYLEMTGYAQALRL